jgi:quinol-cytochrome oxidoreductase complex cytochrome b subunit
MKKNVGTIDRSIRGLAGIALIAAFSLGAVQGALGIVALVIGIAMVGTAVIGYCMPYTWLGINTCGDGQDPKPSA